MLWRFSTRLCTNVPMMVTFIRSFNVCQSYPTGRPASCKIKRWLKGHLLVCQPVSSCRDSAYVRILKTIFTVIGLLFLILAEIDLFVFFLRKKITYQVTSLVSRYGLLYTTGIKTLSLKSNGTFYTCFWTFVFIYSFLSFKTKTDCQ